MTTEAVAKDYDALREDLKTLRSDVAALAEALVATGKEGVHAARASAVGQARRRLEDIASRTQSACDCGRDAVETVERQVVEHPVKSLGIVFGAGMLIGLIVTALFGRSHS